jgi:hypothetical protein
MARFQIIRQMTTGFGNDLNTALDKPLPLPIVLKHLERDIRQNDANTFDRLDNVGQARDKRTCGH